MKLYDILNCSAKSLIENGIDPNKNLEPTRDENCGADSILFYLTPVNEKNRKEEIYINTSAYAIVSDNQTKIKTTAKQIKVDNAREAYAFALSRYYDINYKKMKIIGVTGTNGKTTTATLIYKILCFGEKKAGFIGTGLIEICGNQISDKFYSMTTPDPEVLYKALKDMQDEGCEYVVMEVSSHALELGKVSPIKFEIGLFTNLSPEHMDFHKNINEYFEAKLKLFKNCKKAIYNVDDKYGKIAKSLSPCRAIGLGVIEQDAVYATEIKVKDIDGSTYFYRHKNLIFKAVTNLPGCFNVYNSLMALCCAIELGISPCIAKKGLSSIKNIDGRMEKYQTDITVIIDYAHTPQAFENALLSINKDKITRQNTVCIFGCGGERDKTKRSEMGKIAALHSNLIYITEDNSRSEDFYSIVSDIECGIPKSTHYKIIKKREEAIFSAILSAHTGDRIAILGKGREGYIIDNDGKREYSERAVVESALLTRSRLKINED